MLFDERSRFDSMMAEAWTGTERCRDAGKRLIDLLRDAEQAHVPWVRAELEALLVDGAMARCRTWYQNQKPKVPTREGVEVKTRGGTRRRDPLSGDVVNVQLDFADMDRAQLNNHVRMLSSQIRTEKGMIAAVKRLVGNLDQVPDAVTPREACAALGTTVEAVMRGDKEAAA